MESPILGPRGLVIYLIGKPGAGKSTVARTCISYLTDDFPKATTAHIDEYELLLGHTKTLRSDQVTWLSQGRFEIVDRSLFDELLVELKERIAQEASTKSFIFAEFARSSYIRAFDEILPVGQDCHLVVYVQAPLEVCRKRNRERPSEMQFRSVPDSVLTTFYHEDDFLVARERFGDRFIVVSNASSSLDDLNCACRKLVSSIVATSGAA